jgi:hypothetical protein
LVGDLVDTRALVALRGIAAVAIAIASCFSL